MSKEQTVQLFGIQSDPEIQRSIKRIERGGRTAEVVQPPVANRLKNACTRPGCRCAYTCLSNDL